MGEHTLTLSKLKIPLHFKNEDRASLKPPKVLLKKLGWKDKDTIGIIFETRSEKDIPIPRSIRLVNLTKYPNKELEFETENIHFAGGNLSHYSERTKKALATARGKLKSEDSRQNDRLKRQRRRAAERYLHETVKIDNVIWLHDSKLPLQFISVPLQAINAPYELSGEKRWKKGDYQAFCKDHYIPREYKKPLDILYGNKNKRRKVRKKRSM